MVRLAGFLVLFALLHGAWTAARGTAVERLAIDVATVRVAAALVRTITPEVAAVAEGPRIRAPGGGLNILNGCEGIDTAFLLVAALCVFPLPWRRRLAGIAAGLLFVFVLNQARILALFYAYRADRALFDLLHGTLAPVAMIAASFVFFLWLTKVGAGGTASHAPARP